MSCLLTPSTDCSNISNPWGTRTPKSFWTHDESLLGRNRARCTLVPSDERNFQSQMTGKGLCEAGAKLHATQFCSDRACRAFSTNLLSASSFYKVFAWKMEEELRSCVFGKYQYDVQSWIPSFMCTLKVENHEDASMPSYPFKICHKFMLFVVHFEKYCTELSVYGVSKCRAWLQILLQLYTTKRKPSNTL